MIKCLRWMWPAAMGGFAFFSLLAPAGASATATAAEPVAPPDAATATPAPDITFVGEDDDETSPASGPSNPFAAGKRIVSRKDAVPGYIELSSGQKVPGRIYTTRAKRLKIYNLKRQVYEFVPVPACKRIEAVVEWERQDREWRFKEAGNPEKVYTGRSYPIRMLAWRLTLRNDHQVEGHILGQPLYAEHNGKAERFILHKRDKGPLGGDLKDLVYIRRVKFGPEAYNQAVHERKAKAEAAEAKQENK